MNMEKKIILTFLLLQIFCVFGVRISQEKCDEFEKMFPPIFKSNASLVDETSEELEDEVALEEYSFMAKIYPGKSNHYYNGILISENFVLSVAYTLLSEEHSYAIFGDYVNETDVQPQQLKIIEIIKHPDHEIFLLKLNSSVNFNKYIRPVCLSQPESAYTRQYTQIGWGVRNMLRKETLGLLFNSTCDESTREYYGGEQRFCASTEKGYQCESFSEILKVLDLYASGSALLNRIEMSSYNEIVGIKTLSKAVSCQSGQREDFIRVSAHLDWIENNVWPSGNTVPPSENEEKTLWGKVKCFFKRLFSSN